MKILGFAGFSGCGKTTLLEKVIPSLRHAPAIIIVGGVVSLRDKLAWFHPQ